MEEPWAGIVREESDRDIVARFTHAYDVADDGVLIVVSRLSSAADDVEGVPVQVDRVL